MTPETLARIHAASFTLPRPWSAAEFASLLRDPANFLLTQGAGFILGRTVLDEAELLTLAVSPHSRRRGLGSRLLQAFEDAAVARMASTAFLEVASDNSAARALYASANWQNAGRRRNYYAAGIDAVVMRKDLPMG
ncbi:ribosomal protein S18-alanine N-acetyltransferase [Paracoccus xiamenensis]|uniref:ribosomal protein S18-alanine N-acetyltransferase n=1 Tax=Paracoccus xiamenensis TaxID=2714901 RepID=UPI00140727F4|nr:ribosomal protein S18-alanine N-acetyltransferase [Paracoccus xiamenensis]NHF73968.1 ribosomal protein S18-alanine N-acetyltransferase [Paracoccus xiamenensis]